MGYAEHRGNRWIARYRVGDKIFSAGTYDSEEAAIAAANLAGGTSDGDEELWAVGLTLTEWWDMWYAQQFVAPTTKIGYEVAWRRYIQPVLGERRVGTIRRADVRSLCQSYVAEGEFAKAVRIKAVIGSLYKPLIEDEQVDVNPAHGIRIKNAGGAPFTVLEPEEFKRICAELASPGAQLFAQTLVGTGLRYGEAIELRVKDFTGSELIVARRAQRVGVKLGNGKRYIVSPATKSGKSRVVPISPALAMKLAEHIKAHGIDREDLIFRRDTVVPDSMIRKQLPPLENPEFTFQGRTYRHGTRSAYGYPRCRCDHCKEANAKYYRERQEKVRPRADIETGHLPHETWHTWWKDAQLKAGITWSVRSHDLRHAHATLLIGSGVDIYETKERLGHASITTTEGYLHRIRARASEAAKLGDAFL